LKNILGAKYIGSNTTESKKKMVKGHVYAGYTKSLPGCLKLGITERTHEIRLKEHNAYKNRCKFMTNNIYYDYDYDFIEYSTATITHCISEWEMLYTKKVDHPKRMERILHELLSPYNEYVGSCREIFRITLKQLRHYMRLANMVAEQIEEAEEEFSKKNIKKCVEWVKSIEDEEDEEDQYDEEDDEDRAIMIARAEAKRDAEILAEHKANMKARAKAREKASAIAEKKILAERKARTEALAEANAEPKEIFVGKRSYIYQ
jgi:hypothetical protein